MGTALAFWLGAIIFGALAIRGDIFIRWCKWITELNGKPTDDWDTLPVKVWVRGLGAIGGLSAATIAVLATVRALAG
jgi:hypothetical protein